MCRSFDLWRPSPPRIGSPPFNLHSHPPTLPISRSGGSGKDTTASLIYAWEVNHGSIGPACITPAGKFCNPYEWEGMNDATLTRVVTRKVERYKALKEWRTMSFICEQLTTCSLDDFRIPDTCTIRPPKPNEHRIAKPSEDGRCVSRWSCTSKLTELYSRSARSSTCVPILRPMEAIPSTHRLPPI